MFLRNFHKAGLLLTRNICVSDTQRPLIILKFTALFSWFVFILFRNEAVSLIFRQKKLQNEHVLFLQDFFSTHQTLTCPHTCPSSPNQPHSIHTAPLALFASSSVMFQPRQSSRPSCLICYDTCLVPLFWS